MILCLFIIVQLRKSLACLLFPLREYFSTLGSDCDGMLRVEIPSGAMRSRRLHKRKTSSQIGELRSPEKLLSLRKAVVFTVFRRPTRSWKEFR